MLVTMKEMLIEARHKKYAVGAFEFWSLDSAFAVIEVANTYRTPVILQVGHFEKDYMGGFSNARKIAVMAEKAAGYPVALHLDHSESYDEIYEALDSGFTSVMIDASALPYHDNVELTSRVVELAKKCSASVEAELGRLSGNEGNISSDEDLQTDPQTAADFVKKTGIDALAVAIGSAHGFYKSEPKINIRRLNQIAGLVSVPLVLHGGSGIPADTIKESIKNGISKINICTEFIAAFGEGYTSAYTANDFKCNVPGLFGKGKSSAMELVANKLEMFSGNRVCDH